MKEITKIIFNQPAKAFFDVLDIVIDDMFLENVVKVEVISYASIFYFLLFVFMYSENTIDKV